MSDQQVRGGTDPYVIARDGTHIPVPRQVHRADGSVITIDERATANVTGSSSTHYYVEIRIPSMSGDTRMVLAAAGFGTARGAANAALRTGGFSWLFRWGASQVVARVFGVLIGVLIPNETAAQIFIRRQLESGARVIYVVVA